MALIGPILDDRSFEELKDELLKRIPVYAPEWTDYNTSDPGVALLELFASLGESLLYRFNQIPDATKVAFLRLLGVRPGGAARLDPAHPGDGATGGRPGPEGPGGPCRGDRVPDRRRGRRLAAGDLRRRQGHRAGAGPEHPGGPGRGAAPQGRGRPAPPADQQRAARPARASTPSPPSRPTRWPPTPRRSTSARPSTARSGSPSSPYPAAAARRWPNAPSSWGSPSTRRSSRTRSTCWRCRPWWPGTRTALPAAMLTADPPRILWELWNGR